MNWAQSSSVQLGRSGTGWRGGHGKRRRDRRGMGKTHRAALARMIPAQARTRRNDPPPASSQSATVNERYPMSSTISIHLIHLGTSRNRTDLSESERHRPLEFRTCRCIVYRQIIRSIRQGALDRPCPASNRVQNTIPCRLHRFNVRKYSLCRRQCRRSSSVSRGPHCYSAGVVARC